MTKRICAFISILPFFLFFSACQKEFAIEDVAGGGSSSGTAVFSLAGAPGNCTGAIINGFFQVGIDADTSNKVSLQVDVTVTGSYNISSNLANGIKFASTGTFSTTGVQSIILVASGTPLASGSYNFTPGSAACSFSVTFSGTVANNEDCKDCIYLPFCPGSKYVYTDSTYNPMTADYTIMERKSDFLTSVDTIIDNKPYKKIIISNGSGSSSSYVNCSNGETTTIAYNVQSLTSGNVLYAIKSIEMKANAPIGTSWSDTSKLASGATAYRKHTMAEKGLSRNVSGITYTDVIKISVVQTLFYTDPPLGLVPAGTTEYYIAKGKGLIETITYADNPLTGETYMGYHSVLTSVFIP